MNCQSCSSSLATSQGKFCPFCGVENTQQSNTVAHQAMPQPTFQPHSQQSGNKSTPAWVIILIVAVIAFFLVLCCVGSVLFISSLDESTLDRATDAAIIGDSDTFDPPADDEIVRYLEERYGVNFRIMGSYRDAHLPVLELRPLNQADMDFFFYVRLADPKGNWLALEEVKDGFFLALAGSRIENAVHSYAEDMFGQGSVVEVSAICYVERTWARTLPQSINWNPDDGVDSLRQMVADELDDDLFAWIRLRLYDSDDLGDVTWEQLEDLAEKLTMLGYCGGLTYLSVSGGASMHLEWRAQDGKMFSVEREGW